MQRPDGPTHPTPATMQDAWWRVAVRLRASPRRFVWLLIAAGVMICLLGGCGTRTEPFAGHDKPTPDIAVTTLDEDDIDNVAAVFQLQTTIRRGSGLSLARPLPESLRALVQDIVDKQESRARDLDTLVVVKHAPLPDGLPRHHEELLRGLGASGNLSGNAYTNAVVDFHRDLHTELLRVLREAADRSRDPDVQAFARRQTHGVASILARIDDAF